ncbi:MAG: thioredoxin-disulfide reductase [Clostridia bacterium]
MTDVIILGGGPAGLTAGLYAARAGLSAILFEGELVGGQASTTDKLENYPGFPDGVGGPELMMAFEAQATRLGLQVKYETVTQVDLKAKTVHTRKGVYAARALILATGAKRKKLGVPGEDALTGRGISYCATCDGALYRGKQVCVVGGGATALEDAAYLSGLCEKVTLIHRRDTLRADGKMIERVKANPKVNFCWDSVVSGLKKTDSGIMLTLRSTKTDQSTEIECAACFVAIGTEPVTAIYRGQVEMDEAGYVRAGEDTKSGEPGVFAAGDLRTKQLRQIITAASDGAVAVSSLLAYLSGH